MYGTSESRAHTIDNLISKQVLECVREHVINFENQLAGWNDHEGADITSFAGMVQDDTEKNNSIANSNCCCCKFTTYCFPQLFSKISSIPNVL